MSVAAFTRMPTRENSENGPVALSDAEPVFGVIVIVPLVWMNTRAP